MSNDQLKPELLTINELFANSAVYTVPVYQRNYAWQAAQIEQLISDIHDAMDQETGQEYFLGNLVVTRREMRTPAMDFEVVDGQQRLTTLYLLLTFLAADGKSPNTHHQGCLRYESRARATEALRRAGQEASMSARQLQDSTSDEDTGIHGGFNIIRQHEKLRHQDERGRFADFLRTKVTVVRASLPSTTDLNRYFEVMNTRGQQLKHVDIVKARLMSFLPDDSERAGFAWIWDACSDMDSYVQMSLTRGDTGLRTTIFGENWCWLQSADFTTLLKARPTTLTGTSAQADAALSLDQALHKYARTPHQGSLEEEGSERFRSPIEFPVFLLHVLKVKNSDTADDEGQLDDKRLIQSFTKAIPGGHPAEWVREFAFTLLKCRNLFDSFILKRQFVTGTDDEEGDWSLQCLKKRLSNGRPVPGYVPALSKTEQDIEVDGNADVLLLQSMLRITYTSARNMHWITKVLQWLDMKKPSDVSGPELANLLRRYARSKVAEAFPANEQPQGFDIGRIVFTYLDYLLLTPTTRLGFKFQFRNSIEHFYPQHPDSEQTGAHVSDDNLHRLGNLALVSVRANSKFSNNHPEVKAGKFFKDTIEQSPKLQQMAEITRNEGWGDEQITKHHEQMVALLKADIQN